MLDHAGAKDVASQYLKTIAIASGDELVIVDDLTIEKSYGWIFFFDSARYLATREISHMIVGNGPIVVEKSGAIHRLPAGLPVAEAIVGFERFNKQVTESE